MSRRLVQVVLATLCLAVYAVPSSAQVFTGRIDVLAKDSTGAILPGVSVEVTGPQTARAVTDAQGEAHFLNLAPGRYTVTATLAGFRDFKNDNVQVGAGSVIALPVNMTVGGVTEAVTVQSVTPIIEAKRQTVSTNVSLDELQNVPSSRDPWVVLQTVPGVVVDRVNVGGAESGQQSNYQAKGSSGKENTWNMDGIAITDMAALGASPTYYDFDMFQEMQVTTGGADPSTPTPGVQLNMVLRGGSNIWRGSARYRFENNSLQSNNVSDELAGQIASFNRVKQYYDTGFEVGGPVVRDRLFAWGAYGRTQPHMRICRPNVDLDDLCSQLAEDKTILKNLSFKVTGEIDDATRASFTLFRGDKLKFGRGASSSRPDETTWNQQGPTTLYKFELNRTFTNALFMTARYAHTPSEFTLTPRGAAGATAYRDDSRVWHGNFQNYGTNRPQDNLQFESNYFRGRHELKAGFGWRRSAVTSFVSWPGGTVTYHRTYPNMRVNVARDWALDGEGEYWSAFAGDTISMDRLTFNIGVRWDRQASSVNAASVPENVLSEYLPALDGPAKPDVVVWNSVTPRVGLTYALGEGRKTLLRASYSMFASQLDSNFGATVASSIPYYSYVYYNATDVDGNKVGDWGPSCGPTPITGSRVATPGCEFTSLAFTYGFDPENPLGGNPDKIGDYRTPMTHEFIVGMDHELMANFGVSGSFTYRRMNNFNWLHYNGLTGANYTLTDTYSGSRDPIGSFSVPIYSVDPDAIPADFGRLYEYRKGYTQRYVGFEVSATKRMSNNWMMRAGFSSGANREYFSGPEAQADPTPAIPGTGQFSLTSPNVDGGVVLRQSTGSGKTGIFMALPKYQFILTGVYQAKWGINLGLNYLARQGFATPYYETGVAADDLADKNLLLVSDVDDFRLPTVHSFDARVGKQFVFDRFNLNLDLDAFNLFNASTALGREYDAAADNFNQVLEISNPRIFMLGVRFSFK